jgi:late competence protein required for DNA uptake (superfamily II DNA/RNA helicase)
MPAFPISSADKVGAVFPGITAFLTSGGRVVVVVVVVDVVLAVSAATVVVDADGEMVATDA